MFPAFRAKTSALFIDDEGDFLNDICDFLPNTHHFKKYHEPILALEEINNNLSSSNNFPFKTLDTLWRQFKDFPFANTISVAIVDYRMLPMNGLELCRSIKNPFIKKIMLTSHATEKLAIEAFNNKIIDAFLLKTEQNLSETLAKTMEECTKNFFCDLSRWIKNYQNDYNPLLSKNSDEFLSNLLVKNSITEYCCFHDFNTLWLKSDDNKEQYLTIYSDDTLEELLSTDQSQCAGTNVINDIVQKKAAPCFPYKSTRLMPDGKDWDSFMRPLVKIDQNLYSSMY